MTGAFAKLLVTDPQSWRAHLLALLLRTSMFVSLLVYPPSLYMVIQSGHLGVAVVDSLAVLVVACLYYGKRLPFRVRAWAFCLIGYVLGTALMASVGSISQIYLFGFSIVTTLLLGSRPGLCSVGVSSLTMLAVGYFNLASAEMSIQGWSHDYVSWAVVTLNFGLIGTLLTLTVGAVLAGVESALSREIEARTSLDRERRLLRTVVDALPDVVYVKDAQGRFVIVNPAARAYFGLGREEDLIGKSVFDLVSRELAQSLHADDLLVLAGFPVLNREELGALPHAVQRLYLTIKVPLRDSAGDVVGLVGVQVDVTERRKLELALHQAQKMEAIGKLAGGVAHDFNNMLTVICCSSEYLLAALPPDDRRREYVEQVRRAAERAAGLTQQLLAFSRRTVLEPKVLDPNAVIRETEKMLRRLIGEDVVLTAVLDPNAGRVKVDPTQLGQVLMNLAVNARDAMPKGGKLTIETAAVKLDEAYVRKHPEASAGRFVRISVTDTGTGMAAERIARIFEPFFTTKGVGLGTGLGLAVVHGIIHQSGGHIEVSSEVGCGTTFKVYLPAADEPLSSVPLTEEGDLHGTGTILLVEDEDGVRGMATLALRTYGYAVLPASSGRDALGVLEKHDGGIDLLITDVVMPGMDGRELADALRSRMPHLKVLYVSGYTDDAVVRHGVSQEEMAFLHKPFTLAELASKVRQTLAGDRASPLRSNRISPPPLGIQDAAQEQPGRTA